MPLASEAVAPWVNIIATEVHKAIDPMCQDLSDMSDNQKLEPVDRERLKKMARLLEHTATIMSVAAGTVMMKVSEMGHNVVSIMNEEPR